MRIARPTRKFLAALALTVSSALVACSSGAGSSTDTSGSNGGITIKAAEFSWTAAQLTNEIITEIAKKHPDLGVSNITETQLDPAAAWAGAARGDVQLLTEVALPNQQQLADQAKGEVSIISQTYGNAKQGWFVPKYVVQPGGPAAGLTSVTQLNKYKSVFDGKFYDDDPGYITTQQNTKRLAGYHIDYQHVISSEAAELAQLEKAYQAKKPIVLYLYHPHWVFAKYDMVQLTEPKPYTSGCLTTGNGACAMPAYSANIALNNSVAKEVPKFAALLKGFRISVPEMESMLKKIDIEKQSVEAVARQFISSHAREISTWISAG